MVGSEEPEGCVGNWAGSARGEMGVVPKSGGELSPHGAKVAGELHGLPGSQPQATEPASISPLRLELVQPKCQEWATVGLDR
jgi:hypothetical protein